MTGFVQADADQAEIAALKGRIAALERERDEARAAHDRCFSDCVALQRENKRLRAALEEYEYRYGRVVDLPAREALEPPVEGVPGQEGSDG